MTIKELMELSHKTAVEKGFWESGVREIGNNDTIISYVKDGDRNDGELIALMHSELSEALEGLRNGNPPSDKIPEFTQSEEEFADLMIRIGDMAEKRNMRLEEAIVAKMEYNKSRPHKHGKKF